MLCVLSATALHAAAVAKAVAADSTAGQDTGPPPVHRCETTGFIELPGTDVCLRIGGYVRLDLTALDENWLGTNGYTVAGIAVGGYTVAQSGTVPTVSFGYQDEPLQMYGEARIHLDARTSTGLGTLRAYVEGEAQDNEMRTGGSIGLRQAYVQFGNWLFGKAYSTFLHQESGPNYSDPYTVVGDNSTAMRRNQIRYTQPLAGGLSLALALEDQNYDEPPAAIVGVGPNVPISNPAATALSVATDGGDMPDVVAALRWDDHEIGSAQIAGALHRNRYAEMQTIGGVSVPSFSDGDLGFALMFGLALDLPTGAGDTFTFLTNYTDGASQYLQDMYGSGTTIVWGRCGLANCILDRLRIWSAVSSVTHYWTPTVATTVGAGYSQTDYGAVGTALSGSGAVPGVLDVATYELFANIEWTPARQTEFMLDIHYGHIDYRGFDLDPARPGIQDSQGAWAATFEVTRRF